ncbi:MAG: hypothetical protein K9I59_01915 [Chlorobium sp.]|jgi:hypothetical protein|uniref:hypothetical protein n=1 Tax=Chlorobium sp. TaxID=1095 RepID=UPI001D7A0124|nr:hypothetical protein [Chlorobium sp.]MBN1279888.1 hypothetical protein [Chlorobiaceae bacterium]MCF8215609.1 hypothetical protein [Chlorobium sp.]MCF8270664.1 hypothetical protein [Chlorobium sp.]MCF8286818.1 hypothetical protein [Chlorobium sp.]MCF8290606.1 hypothetical protein [Chlorobium sp.]
MGKRQIIYRPAQIGGNQALVNREVNLVTRELRVWHGVVTSVGSSEIELKDARKGKHTFTLEQIDKIYDEVITDY